MNSIEAIASSLPLINQYELQCPYYDASQTCNASLSSLLPSPALRENFCGSEDYDDCPMFLAKFLRRWRK